MNVETGFQIANLTAVAGWLVLLLSPFIPRWTDRIPEIAIPLLLAIAYAGLIPTFFGQTDGGFDSLENVMKLFTLPHLVLAGWIHYLAFDLFVGAWEVRTARREGIFFLLVVPCLALTFMFGPAGFLAFTVVRGAYAFRRPA